MIDSKVQSINDRVISGVGIRIFKGTRSVSGSTSSLEREDLLACAVKVAGAMDGLPEGKEIILRERIFGDIHPIVIVPSTAEKSCGFNIVS